MKLRLITFIALFVSLTSFSQENEIEDTSLSGQFDKIYRTSTTYQVYKVISKEKYLELKQNVLDTLKTAKNLIIEKERLLKTEKDNIKKTEQLLSKTQLDLEEANKKENSISLFGLQVSKTSYNLILWSMILVLLVSLSYFVIKFLRSNILTKEAQENLEEVASEFEQHRKKTLEKEQKLRRQLQDEINKQRNA